MGLVDGKTWGKPLNVACLRGRRQLGQGGEGAGFTIPPMVGEERREELSRDGSSKSLQGGKQKEHRLIKVGC